MQKILNNHIFEIYLCFLVASSNILNSCTFFDQMLVALVALWSYFFSQIKLIMVFDLKDILKMRKFVWPIAFWNIHSSVVNKGLVDDF